MPELGLAVITYNRQKALQICLERIQAHTRTPYELVIADDGSEDGSVEWARAQGLRVITGQRRGVVWNRNRALAYLQGWTPCDPILMLEDDAWPTEPGWEQPWVEAARQWGHLSYALPVPGSILRGAGTAQDPYVCRFLGGICLSTSRAALWSVGYLDTRFRGYGFGHAEWSYRFARLFSGRWFPPLPTLRGLQDVTCLGLNSGLQAAEMGSWANPQQMERNRRVFLQLLDEPIWRPPARDQAELKTLGEELGEALGVPVHEVCQRLSRSGRLPGAYTSVPPKPRRLFPALARLPLFNPR